VFGTNIKILRWVLSWNFAFLSLLSIVAAFWIILRTLHLQLAAARSHPLALFIDVILPAMAAVFGVAWWKVWKEMPSARAWGIGASVLLAAHPLWRIVRFPRSIHGYNVLALAIGIAGLVVFSMRNETLSDAGDPEPEDSLSEGN
jgi:hypothetical protein